MYYYFVSSLPYMQFDAAPPFTVERFVELCREHLKPKDRVAFDALVSGTKSPHPFARAWREFDTKFRNAVVKQRAERLGVGADKWLRPQNGCSGDIEQAVETAFAEPDPMRRDIALKRIMWNKADELAGHEHFHSSSVFANYIRLQILTQRATTNNEKGGARLLNHVNNFNN